MENVRTIADNTANPAPLGLSGFALSTILLNVHNAGFFGLDSMIMAMGIFYGGIAQVLVGYMEWKKGNTFGTAAFTSYGLFWISLITLMILPKIGYAEKPSSVAMAFYLGFWGLFSLGLFVGTLKINRALTVVFGLVVLLFALLTLATITGNHAIHTLAGYEGIICGLSALYVGMAQVINDLYKKELLPL